MDVYFNIKYLYNKSNGKVELKSRFFDKRKETNDNTVN